MDDPAAPGVVSEEAAGFSDAERERLGANEFAICIGTFYEELAERLVNSAIRITATAALRPWSRLSPPERASACSIVSQVTTPKAHGTPVWSWTLWIPRAASAQTWS